MLKNSEIERPRESRFRARRVISTDSPDGRAYGRVVRGKTGRSAEPLRKVPSRLPVALAAGLLVCTAATADDSFTGKYARAAGTYKWHAIITPTGGQIYKVSVQVSSTMPGCSGAFEAIGRLQAGRIVTQPDQDDSCVLTISRSGGGIAVDEQSCTDHGEACPFTSLMKRVGR